MLIYFKNSAQKTWDALSDVGELVKTRASNRTEFLQECREGKYDGVVAIYRTFHSISITGLIDEELVNALPKSLKYMAHCGLSLFGQLSYHFMKYMLIFLTGAGYDMIDVHACTARNPPIRVSNVPNAVDNSTADVNIFLILGALRNFNSGMQSLREGKFLGATNVGHDPQGKVLGILGMGGIGRNLKKKAEAFGMKVIYHNRRQLSEKLAGGAQYVTFDELLATSDVLSLNLPLNVSHLYRYY